MKPSLSLNLIFKQELAPMVVFMWIPTEHLNSCFKMERQLENVDSKHERLRLTIRLAGVHVAIMYFNLNSNIFLRFVG